jgi:glycosyltransferase involved in cell wall biosynthesis
MKMLIAIISCQAFTARAQAQRDTWIKDIPPGLADLRFFVGRGPKPTEPDVIQLDVPDDYRGLTAKTKAVCAWAEANGYEFLWKLDDDIYVQPGRLLAVSTAGRNYIGRKRGPSGGFPAPYASGFAYGLSLLSMRVIIAAPLAGDTAEDRSVGNALLGAGIPCENDPRFVIIDSRKNMICHSEGPREGNDIIASGEFPPQAMFEAHRQWKEVLSGIRTGPLIQSPFRAMSVLIKTFMRDGYLGNAIKGIQNNLPGAELVIVDDGYEGRPKLQTYAELRNHGHQALWLPFDSGFGAKANAGVQAATRPFILIGSDDFQFDVEAMDGIANMLAVLHSDKGVDVISGTVNRKPYHALLRIEGADCYEERGHREVRQLRGFEYLMTDLTVNYSLIRREVFEKIRWDEDVKIGGGEHGAFFIDLMRAGFKVAVLPVANINEARGVSGWARPEYGEMRARARQPGRICLKRRGIDRFHLMDGGVDVS